MPSGRGKRSARIILFLCVYLLHHEALDDVAFLDVVELFDLHAAFVTGGDFLNVVLEAAQRSKLALMDNDIVAQDTDSQPRCILPSVQ